MRLLRVLLPLFTSIIVFGTYAQQSNESIGDPLYYPNGQWEEYTDPSQLGYDLQQVGEAKAYFDSTHASSVLVLYKGKILINWGDNTRRFRSASIRKSFLNALLGIAVSENRLSIEDRIGEFQVPGVEELTALEKKATIQDLMTASSGVYLPAAYEPQVWTDRKPKRGSNAPGTTWYYNNWDFNVLGAVYNHVSQNAIETDFKNKIADKIGMEDFRPDVDFKYFYEKDIPVPAYLFKMSSRDMARFGLLFLRNGKWGNEQVVPESWITESTTKIKTPWKGVGYGYLWWTTNLEDGSHVFYASGTGVQSILVVPEKDIVMVFRANTYLGPEVPNGVEIELLDRIVKAKTSNEHATIETKNVVWHHSFTNNADTADFQNWVGAYSNNIARRISIDRVDGKLLLKTKIADFLMYPMGKNLCWVEDLNVTATMKDSGGEEPTSTLTKDGLLLFK